MTPAEETADVALQALTRIIGGYPELARRARISSRADGYPRRASGAQPGTVAPTFDPDRALTIGGIAISYSDPTGLAATNGDHRPDPVTRRLRTLERNLNTARRHLEAAAAQLVDPRDFDEGGPWCASCARVKHDDGRPWLSPPDSRRKGPTDVRGRLKEPMHLCVRCVSYVEAEGALPPRALLAVYLATGRMPKVKAS